MSSSRITTYMKPGSPAVAVSSQPARLYVSGKELVRRRRGLEADRRADFAAGLGAVAARAARGSPLRLVAIATVADVVPLTGENRVIVKRGLEGLRQVTNPGLRAAGRFQFTREIASRPAFRVAPRINAAGRMASANDVIEMFLTSDAARAQGAGEAAPI